MGICGPAARVSSPKTLLFYERGSREHEAIRDVMKKTFDLIMDVDAWSSPSESPRPDWTLIVFLLFVRR